MSASRRLKIARQTRRKIGLTVSLMQQGQLTLEHILTDPPPHLNHVRISSLLIHAPKLGEAGMRKCLREAEVDGIEFIGALDSEARRRIVAHLPPRAR